MSSPESVAAVVGQNLRRLRQEARLTQYEIANLLSQAGVPMQRSKVAAIEAGTRPNMTLADVLALAIVLDVGLAELLGGEGTVRLAGSLAVSRQALSGFLRGEVHPVLEAVPVTDSVTGTPPDLEQVHLARRRLGISRLGGTDADQALAKRLGVPHELVTRMAFMLWGHSLTDERDLRVDRLGDVGPRERQAHRGHITRELADEVEAELQRRGHIAKSNGDTP